MNRMHIEQTLINKVIDNLPEQLKLILEPHALTYGKNNSQLYDGCLNLEVSETGCYQFYFDVKLNLRKEILIKWLRSHSNEDCLLITDVLTPNLQQYCIENSINFIDSAGNLFIQRPGLFLLIRGQKSTVRLRQTNTLTIGIMKLLFVILADKELINHSYREIAEMANISLGMVSKGFSYLKNNQLYRESSTGRRLTSPDELYTQWIQNYATILRPKFKILTLSDEIDWQTILLLDGEYWGGEAAAYQLTHGYLRPEIIQLFTPYSLLDRRKTLNMRPIPTGKFQLIETFWGKDFKLTLRAQVLLSIAELIATQDERNIETARRLNEQYLQIKAPFI